MEDKLSFRLAEYLFRNAYPVYKILYRNFKNRQDAEEISYLKKEIKKGDIVLDIGANIGFYATIISDLVGENGKVYCFEPDNKNYSYLQKTTSGLKNVETVNAAIADKKGELEIFTSHRLNVDHRMYKPEQYDSSYIVPAISIDEYLGSNLKVNFIKIDIQGFELSAFKGMQKTLQFNKGIKILTEFWPHGLQSAGTSAEELLDYMSSMGFNAYQNKNNQFIPLNKENIEAIGNGENDYCNVVFRN